MVPMESTATITQWKGAKLGLVETKPSWNNSRPIPPTQGRWPT